MTYNLDDTIAAIASAGGGGARGIVRVSGPSALSIAEAAFKVDEEHSLESKKHPTAATGTVNLWFDDAALRGMPGDLYFWPTERSYTRQPVAEFHTLGSPPLLQALLDQVCRCGARLAEPGEFTLRAFLAGRLDLTQAEAVLGVIDAEHQNQLASALAQLAGGLARPLHELRDELLQLLAELEAGLDFADEDIEFVAADEVLSRLHAAGEQLEAVTAQMVGRTIAHSTPQVVLVGRPNAGKSSLFNALVSHCQSLSPTPLRPKPAIVSEQQGTTRDYLTSIVRTGGFQFELVDTAGTQASANLPSQPTSRAMELAKATPDSHAQQVTAVRRQQAVARVLCIEVSVDQDETEIRSDLTESIENQSISIVALTKSDLASRRAKSLANLVADVPAVVTSSIAGHGLSELLRVIARQLANVESGNASGCVAATADRCRDSLRLATAAIGKAMEASRAHAGDELVAAELRTTLAELGKVVGAVYTDDILDRIFGSFCIGK